MLKIDLHESGACISFNVNDLSDPGAKGINPFGEKSDTHFLVKTEGKIRCYSNVCPHLGYAPLAWRKDKYLTDSGQIHCGVHGALFEAESGLCVVGPCLDQRLKDYPVNIEDGVVTVIVPLPARTE